MRSTLVPPLALLLVAMPETAFVTVPEMLSLRLSVPPPMVMVPPELSCACASSAPTASAPAAAPPTNPLIRR